tara:strand:+ start:1543 stop:2886 length:1344 start_codon:yes stop_codon:yes gene_type:complete
MCGILVSSKEIKKPISNLLTNRGPDHTSITSAENINFVHTLLSMTGEFTPQPIFKNNVYFLLNGEIYNFDQNKEYLSDIFYIVDLYFEYEEKFVNYLEGEFSVVIIDFNKNTSYFATDIFGIKPLYYSIEESQFGVCSYEEPLIELGFQNVKKVEPSSMIKFCIKTHKVQKTIKYFEFELRQFKNKYDDWVDSFISAVEKRFKKTDKEIILPLSSGFDSGAIACAFKLLNINSTIYSFSNYEHVRILNKRLKLLDGFKKIYSKAKLTEKERELAIELIKDKCSIFDYGPNLKKDDSVFDGINDPGAHGLAFLLNEVKNDNRKIKILASGHGADEIMSNIDSYHFGEPNPEKFPENLEDIFPWQNFYFGTQSSYLSKEESISGGFGIEGRYPFLDKNVVQEFLNLNNNLKNKQFKAPIVYMLKKYKFPYRKERTITGRSVSVKSGFNA